MVLILNRYCLVLRLCTYALPLPAFATARALLPGFGGALYQSPLYILLVATTLAVWAAAAEHYQLSSADEWFRESACIRRVFPACVTTYLIVIAIGFLAQNGGVSRGLLLLSAALLFVYTLVVHRALRMLVRKGPRRALKVLIVGADGYARRAVRRLQNPHFPCPVMGYVRLPGQSIRVKGASIHELADLEQLCLDGVNDILIALGPAHMAELPGVIRRLDRFCVPIRMIVDFGANVFARDRIFQFGRLQLLDVARSPAESLAYGLCKRAFDIIFALLAILLSAPLMAVIALGIKLTSPGPIFFRQERVGQNGRVFTMLKFRTMRVASADESDTRWTVENDPRRTAFGAFLRATSLDELPQFFNVLRGDMSVVGPRPERPHFVRQFLRDIDTYNSRHRLKVGITGWAQVNGWRGNTSIKKRVEYDLYYLRNWSFSLDLRIIWLTVWSGLFNRNAY
jgi:Undecaprenyl-phosphate glucose phosphotransferase